jgi:hypothetical protein
VVCTDVGASARVLTEPSTNACYSAIVAPNSPLFLARAQIKLLALLEEWSQYSDPSCCSPSSLDSSFPDVLTKDDIVRITNRMYEQTAARRDLGMKSREIVKASFSGERYLREHEQMLWIGKARKDMTLPVYNRPSARMDTPATVRILDERAKERVPMPRQSIRERERSRKSRELGSLGLVGRESASLSIARGELSLPNLAFGNSTLEASLLTDGGPSSAQDASTTRESRLRETQGQIEERDINAINAGGGGRGRRDSSMVEKWVAEVAKM